MDKKKQGLLGGGILVLALIAAVGIVYAAYSQSLSINGEATVKANSWKIKFANLGEVVKTGNPTITTAPTIVSDTKIGDFAVTISKPGDSVTYNFDIVNDGTFNAEADPNSVTGLKPTCQGSGDNGVTDAANVCKHLTYEWIIPESVVQDGKIKLNAKSTATGFGIKLTYASDIPAEELPSNDVVISGLDTSINFKQAE